MVALWLWWACSAQQPLSEEALLTRLSIDLRGVRPTVTELEAIDDPDFSFQQTIDSYLSSPEFPRQMAHFFASIYNTRQDETLYPAADFDLTDEFAFAFAVGDEPLRIIEEVIDKDLPWPMIVTADWTMLNDDLLAIYPAVALTEEDGWRRATYIDGRPSAGVLSTNGFWWRYETSQNNASRARANQISRILLCRDYLDQEVVFDRSLDLSDEEVRDQALQNNDGCISCHASLDPLASFLGGVFVPRKSGATEMLYYHPERESIWRDQTGVPPAYYGKPGDELSDLGRFIAEDPQFARCTVEQVTSFLWQQPVGAQDSDLLFSYREDFLRGGLHLKDLIKSIVSDQRYQRSIHNSRAVDKVVSPIQLASILEELSGFRFVSDNYDMLLSERSGFYAMIGGNVQGEVHSRTEISVPLLLVQEQLAVMAADHWIEKEPEKLGFDPEQPMSESVVHTTIQTLHRRILSRSVSAEALSELSAYHQAVVNAYGEKEAWKAIVRLLLQDPQLLVY